jgi:hypothetical protein
MGRPLTGKIVSSHDTLKTTPLAGPCNIHGLDLGKDVDADLLPDLKTVNGSPEFANESLGLTISPRKKCHASGRPPLRAFTAYLANMTTL